MLCLFVILRFSLFPATKLISSSTETDFHFRRRLGWLFFSFTAGTSFSLVNSLSVVSISSIEKIRISISLWFGISRPLSVVSIGISVISISKTMVSKSIVSTIQEVGISISLGLRISISRPLAIVSIGISVVSISKSVITKSIVSTIKQVGVSISFWFSLSLTLSIVMISIGRIVVSSIS